MVRRKSLLTLTLLTALGTLTACGSGTDEEEQTAPVVNQADFAFVETDPLDTGYRYMGPRPTGEQGSLYLYDREQNKWTTVSSGKIVSGQLAYGQDTLYLPLDHQDQEISDSSFSGFQRSYIDSLTDLLPTDQGVLGYSDSSMTDDAGKMTSFVLKKEKGQTASYEPAGAEIYTADTCGSEVWGLVRGEQRTLNEVPTSTTQTLLESLKESITFARIDDVAASKKSFTPQQNHRVVGHVACDGQKLYQLVNIYANDGQVQTSDPAQSEGVTLESEPVALNILVFDTASGEFSEVPVSTDGSTQDFGLTVTSAYESGRLWLVDLSGKVMSIDTTSGELTEAFALELPQDVMSEQENAIISGGKLTYFNASDPAKPLLYTYELEKGTLEAREELPALKTMKAGEFSLGDILSFS